MIDMFWISSIDFVEVVKFQVMVVEWWDLQGKFKLLYMLNFMWLEYVIVQIVGQFGCDCDVDLLFQGLSIFDIGCGGGLMVELLVWFGVMVMGVDVVECNIVVVSLYVEEQGFGIDYCVIIFEVLVVEGYSYDVVMVLEIVEYVVDFVSFIVICCDLVKFGGLLIQFMLNCNLKSFLMGIIGVEWVMCWLFKGIYDWCCFIMLDEFVVMMQVMGLEVVDCCGMVFNFLGWSWLFLYCDLLVNYVMMVVCVV